MRRGWPRLKGARCGRQTIGRSRIAEFSIGRACPRLPKLPPTQSTWGLLWSWMWFCPALCTCPPHHLPAYLFPARVQITGKLPFISQYPISATAAAHPSKSERERGVCYEWVGWLPSLARLSPALRHFCRFEKKPNDPRVMRAARRGYEMQSISARSRAS